MKLSKVKEVEEISVEKAEDCYRVNSLLKQNWMVIQIVPYKGGLLFVLGRL